MNTNTGRILAVVCLSALLSAGAVFAQILRVDSVTVDSVWNSDSSWQDGNNVLQQRVSRDCNVSFIPQGEGTARMLIALSIDSGKTWSSPSSDLFFVRTVPYPSVYVTGQKAAITVRVIGGDRPGVAFKMTARQASPMIRGNPKLKILGWNEILTPGASADAALDLKRGTSGVETYGYCPLSMVYWDALGDGTIDDSTTGVHALSWVWHTQVPSAAGPDVQKRKVIARAIDKNNMWTQPETLTVQFGLQRPVVMKDIPAGIYDMGETDIAGPVHQVTLSAFRMQETEVTYEQYLAVTGLTPAYFNGEMTRPVEQVTWFDAVKFCNALSLALGLSAVYDTSTWTADFSESGYRLPTEAQWEYACRGGTTTTYWWGPDTNGLGAAAWISCDSTRPVATKMANPYGLYDITGNVAEWCNDWYLWDYALGAVTNPVGPASGSSRVTRGGNYIAGSSAVRSADHYGASSPDFRGWGLGFRVVLPSR